MFNCIIWGHDGFVDYRCADCDNRVSGPGRIEIGRLECNSHGAMIDVSGDKLVWHEWGYYIQ